MTDIYNRRVISLNPFTVDDELLAAIEAEVTAQSEDDIQHIEAIDTLVLDTNQDSGLDSHATIFTTPHEDGGDGS